MLGLFSEGLIIGRNFAFQNGLGLAIKTLQKHRIKTAVVLTVHGLIFRRAYHRKDKTFAPEIWGTYFREGLFLGKLEFNGMPYIIKEVKNAWGNGA